MKKYKQFIAELQEVTWLLQRMLDTFCILELSCSNQKQLSPNQFWLTRRGLTVSSLSKVLNVLFKNIVWRIVPMPTNMFIRPLLLYHFCKKICYHKLYQFGSFVSTQLRRFNRQQPPNTFSAVKHQKALKFELLNPHHCHERQTLI